MEAVGESGEGERKPYEEPSLAPERTTSRDPAPLPTVGETPVAVNAEDVTPVQQQAAPAAEEPVDGDKRASLPPISPSKTSPSFLLL